MTPTSIAALYALGAFICLTALILLWDGPETVDRAQRPVSRRVSCGQLRRYLRQDTLGFALAGHLILSLFWPILGLLALACLAGSLPTCRADACRTGASDPKVKPVPRDRSARGRAAGNPNARSQKEPVS